MIDNVAKAMETRRRELIAQPLNRIWPELARAAIEAMADSELTDAMYFAACDEMDEWVDPEDGECIKAVIKTVLRTAAYELPA